MIELQNYALRTGVPELDRIVNVAVGVFMWPGEAMIHSLARTSWGRDWGVDDGDWRITAMAALLFWCLAVALLQSMSRNVKQFLARNDSGGR